MKIKYEIEPSTTPFIQNGQCLFTVVVPSQADCWETEAKNELTLLFKKSMGTEPACITADQARGTEGYIFLGRSCGCDAGAPEALGLDGYTIFTRGGSVYLCGAQRGTLFAAYELCRILIGYRYYAIDEMRVNSVLNATLPEINIEEKPDIEARSLGFYETFKLENPDFAAHANRLRLGRNMYSDWVLAAHTYFVILPKDQYYERHKEWYSPDGNNLCLSSENMTEEFAERVTQLILEKPGNYVMIGQEDNFGFCDCPACKAQAEKYGGESAVMMRFSNKVARAVKEKLAIRQPGRKITLVTFAYNRTASPPVRKDEKTGELTPADTSVVAEDNLAVMVVPFSAVYSESFFSERYNKKVKDHFLGWSKVSKNLHVWTYCVNFDNYMVNFNNLSAIKTNYALFKDLGVTFVFDQGPHNSRTPSFDELRQYVQSALLWDTTLDTEQLIDEFMDNYYLDVAPLMKRYLRGVRGRWNRIEEMGEKTRSGGGDSSFWNLREYWPKEFLDECFETFRSARGILERLRVDEWDKYVTLKRRIKKQSLSVRFLLLNLYGAYYGSELAKKVETFKNDCKECGIDMNNEGNFMELC